VSPDEELCASVTQCAHGVSIPNFLIKSLSHGMIPHILAGQGRWTDYCTKASTTEKQR
jgi:hypothetical protein